MKTVEIRQFDGGITNDPRDPHINLARYLVNFDALTNSYKLTPRRDSESGDNAASTSQKQNFAIALWGPTGTYRLFSLGVKSGAGTAEVLMKTLQNSGGSDLTDSSWLSPANNQSSGGSTSFNLFTYYKTTGKIYGAKAGTTIWAFTPDGSTAFDDSNHSLSYTNIAEGLVHSKDDILYIPYDNKIASNNNGSWVDAAITLPSNLYITAICERGNYLAIAAAPLSGVGGSKVYLWDRDTSLTTLSEVIDWGEGVIKVIQELNGTLIGISLVGGDATRVQDRVVFKYYTGQGAETFYTLQGTTSTQLRSAKQRVDNRLLFSMMISLNGSVRAGVWSVGRKGSGEFSIIHESTPNNDTALTLQDNMLGFIKVGDFLFQAYQPSGVFALSKTNDQSSYTATSIYETTINPSMPPADKIQKKQLISVGAMYEALPAAGQVVVKYKVDGGAWTTIFTETTDNAVSTEPFTNAAGTQFTSGKEFEFRIESTGGAEITGLTYKYEVLDSNI